MAQIILNIPDNKVSEILDAFAIYYGWNANLGVTKAQFAKAKVIDFIKQVYKSELGKTALATIQGEVDSVVID